MCGCGVGGSDLVGRCVVDDVTYPWEMRYPTGVVPGEMAGVGEASVYNLRYPWRPLGGVCPRVETLKREFLGGG